MTDSTDEQPMLPGLDDDDPIGRDRLVDDVKITLREYRDAGLITVRDTARVSLCLELAAIIGIKRRGGRLSTVSNDARLLDEILCSFVGEGQEVDEKLAEAMRQWTAEVESTKRAS